MIQGCCTTLGSPHDKEIWYSHITWLPNSAFVDTRAHPHHDIFLERNKVEAYPALHASAKIAATGIHRNATLRERDEASPAKKIPLTIARRTVRAYRVYPVATAMLPPKINNGEARPITVCTGRTGGT